MSDKLEVPRLKVRRDWYVGLLPDPVDHSHPDVHDDLLTQDTLIPRTSLCFIQYIFLALATV